MLTSNHRLCMISAVLCLSGCANNGVFSQPQVESLSDYSNVYLIGTFNWFEAVETFRFVPKGNNLYVASAQLIADGQPYDFKVSDPKWSESTNCGRFLSEQVIEINEKVTLYCAADSGTIKFTPPTTAVFTFSLDVSINKTPKLIITQR